MDNINNRLHYWNVKQFLGKKPEMAPPQKNTLRDSIQNIVNKKSEYKQSNFVNDRQIVNKIGMLSDLIANEDKKYRNNNPGQGKNNPSNPFHFNKPI
jgi:hypothetical protein